VSFVLANALLITYLEDQRGENAQARETAISWLLKKQKANEASQPKQSFYGDLYKQVTDLEAERRNLPNPARLVSLAEFPLQPTSPKRFRLLAAGFVIATVLAGFLVTLEDLKGRRRIRLPGAMREPETGTDICAARHAPACSTPSPSGRPPI
jgi:hypothetical protein